MIGGKVQGVGFRYFTLKTAQKYRLIGTVQNLENGKVELVVEGTKKTIEDFIFDLRKGNGICKIEYITTDWSNSKGNFKDFQIK